MSRRGVSFVEIAIRIFLGAAVGSLLGWFIGRSRLCSAQACRAKANLFYSILAGAVFGAAVAWAILSRSD